MDPALVLEASAKALLYASVLVVIGASCARWLLLPRVAAEIGVAGVVAIEDAIARLALLAAVVALVATSVRVWTHTVSAFGFDGARSWETIKVIALQSRWGHGWQPQAVAACILVLACGATVRRRGAWPLATLAALAFTATIPRLGHASGDAGRLAIHSVHMLAAGAWLGTLAVILLIRLPLLRLASNEPPVTRQRLRWLILRGFSPIALSAAATAVVAGLVAAWVYVGAIANLWTSTYGRVLVLKMGLVGAASLCGYVNWQRLRRPRAQSESSASFFMLEALLAIAVVITTGYLTEIGHP